MAPDVPTSAPQTAPRGLAERRLLRDRPREGWGAAPRHGVRGSCASERQGHPRLPVLPTQSLLRPAVSRLQLSCTMAGPRWSLFPRLAPEMSPTAAAAPPPAALTASSGLCTPAGLPQGPRKRRGALTRPLLGRLSAICARAASTAPQGSKDSLECLQGPRLPPGGWSQLPASRPSLCPTSPSI